ncbi:uncharacterized protein LOC106150714 [Lingula anatina]|uniref:Uncharacterized protein LOC106150714 n=1 Tax=Lingula anatina TaxID=7574 RepID=A0A1S3GZF9_LINAN|nr:uncharacterized protein LOC106150714 [Lingula anatina]|eukprot:XP_013379133.1 uncharacterized protein LOC106150714 [Lingula anatina]
MSAHNSRKLVLHFDLRNTILVADSVTNINVEQGLNSYLTGVTWGKEDDKTGEWTWVSDTPSLDPPNEDCVTYYKYLEKELVKVPYDRLLLRQATGDFTQVELGRRFSTFFDKHLRLLEWTHGKHSNVKAAFYMHGTNGRRYHYLLPSFFNLLSTLYSQGRDFCVVLRTYGMDAANVLECIKLFTGGLHPDFPHPLPLKVHTKPGAILRNGENFELKGQRNECDVTLSSEDQIYSILSEGGGIRAFVDDFANWQNHGYHYSKGKPLWINLHDTSVQHILFDDNIRVTEDDSVANVRLFSVADGSFRSLSKEHASRFQDTCLVQADLLESIQRSDYFIEKVKACEDRYNNLLQQKDVFNSKKHAMKYS